MSIVVSGSGWDTVFAAFCGRRTTRGILFLLLFAAAARLVSQENDCSGNDGVGKLFWYIKKLQFLLVLGGN